MLNPEIPDEKKYKFGIVMTGSKFNNDYKYLPQDYVFEGVDHEELDNYLEALEEMKEESDYIPPSFVCFDDLVGILSKFDGPLFQQVSTLQCPPLYFRPAHIHRCVDIAP